MFGVIRKLTNLFIFKSKYRIYVSPHSNAFIDKYSLENANSDNVLAFVKYLKDNSDKISKKYFNNKTLTIYLETEIDSFYSNKGLIIKPIKKANKNNKIIYILNFIKNSIIRYSCSQWWCDSPGVHFDDRVLKQKVVCFNYSTAFKNCYCRKSNKLWEIFTHIFVTSSFDARIQISDFGGNLSQFYHCGYPRNDALINNNKVEEINKWLTTHNIPLNAKLIVYAPTVNENGKYFKDYLFGYDDNNELNEFLEKNSIFLIYKPHPLERFAGKFTTKNVIEYDYPTTISLYDLLFKSDALITNFSSVAMDYLITGKPVIYNFVNINDYSEYRGLDFDPPFALCSDDYVDSWEGLKFKLLNLDAAPSKRYLNVQKIFNTYIDGDSKLRICSILFEQKGSLYQVKEWDPK